MTHLEVGRCYEAPDRATRIKIVYIFDNRVSYICMFKNTRSFLHTDLIKCLTEYIEVSSLEFPKLVDLKGAFEVLEQGKKVVHKPSGIRVELVHGCLRRRDGNTESYVTWVIHKNDLGEVWEVIN